MTPKISIIVPVYNVEKYLHECIKSILGQNFREFELILVDDGSKDSCGQICDDYAKMDKRIRVIHKENGGLSSARNKGIEIACADFIGFVDGDDWIDKEMYEVLYSNMITSNAQISACNLCIMNKNNEFFPNSEVGSDFIFDTKEAMEELYTNQKLTFSSCNKLFSKSLFQNLRYREGIILEDMDLAYKLIYNAKTITYTSKPLYYYRYNNTSILRGNFSEKRVDEYQVKKEMYEFYAKNFPNVSEYVYADLFFTGIRLYSMIIIYKKELAKKYKFLITADKRILKSLLRKKNYSNAEKLQIIFYLLHPSLLINIYSSRYLVKDKINSRG